MRAIKLLGGAAALVTATVAVASPALAQVDMRNGSGTIIKPWRNGSGTIIKPWRNGSGTIIKPWRNGSGTIIKPW